MVKNLIKTFRVDADSCLPGSDASFLNGKSRFFIKLPILDVCLLDPQASVARKALLSDAG